MFNVVIRLTLLFFFVICALHIKSQEIENENRYHIGYTADIKLIKDLRLDLSPEIRLNDDFSIRRIQQDIGISYSPVKNISLGSYYRFMLNKEEGDPDEILNQAALNISYKIKVYRFRPSVRIQYSGILFEEEKDHLMRYKGGLKYKIKKSKFTPGLAFEVFHLLEDNVLEKYRTAAVVEYSINKKNSISGIYKFDYYKTEYLNRHIVQLVYEMKF